MGLHGIESNRSRSRAGFRSPQPPQLGAIHSQGKVRAAQSEFNILVGMLTRPIRKGHDAPVSRNSPFTSTHDATRGDAMRCAVLLLLELAGCKCKYLDCGNVRTYDE